MAICPEIRHWLLAFGMTSRITDAQATGATKYTTCTSLQPVQFCRAVLRGNAVPDTFLNKPP